MATEMGDGLIDADFGEAELRPIHKREIFRKNGSYDQCQVLNWEHGEPPKFLACHALDGTGDFIAAQRMGTWAEIDIYEVERRLNGTWPELAR